MLFLVKNLEESLDPLTVLGYLLWLFVGSFIARDFFWLWVELALVLVALISFLVDFYKYYKVYNRFAKFAYFAVVRVFNRVVVCGIIGLMVLETIKSISSGIVWILRSI